MEAGSHAKRVHVLVLALPLAGASLLADCDRRDVGDLLGGRELHEVRHRSGPGELARQEQFVVVAAVDVAVPHPELGEQRGMSSQIIRVRLGVILDDRVLETIDH